MKSPPGKHKSRLGLRRLIEYAFEMDWLGEQGAAIRMPGSNARVRSAIRTRTDALGAVEARLVET